MIASRNQQAVSAVMKSLTRENDILVEQLHQIHYWYRGAITREEVWHLTPYEREKAIDFLDKRFKEAGDAIKKGVTVFI